MAKKEAIISQKLLDKIHCKCIMKKLCIVIVLCPIFDSTSVTEVVWEGGGLAKQEKSYCVYCYQMIVLISLVIQCS